MKDLKSARRFAQALLEAATEKKKDDKVFEDLKMISGLYEESADFQRFLNSPLIKAPKKIKVLDAIFKGNVNDLALNLMKVLAREGHEAGLPLVIELYEQLRNEQIGVVKAVVTTAMALDSKQAGKLEEQLAKFTGKKPEMAFRTDKSIIGGFVARIGDTVVDGSVKRQIELLKERFGRASHAHNN